MIFYKRKDQKQSNEPQSFATCETEITTVMCHETDSRLYDVIEEQTAKTEASHPNEEPDPDTKPPEGEDQT